MKVFQEKAKNAQKELLEAQKYWTKFKVLSILSSQRNPKC